MESKCLRVSVELQGIFNCSYVTFLPQDFFRSLNTWLSVQKDDLCSDEL